MKGVSLMVVRGLEDVATLGSVVRYDRLNAQDLTVVDDLVAEGNMVSARVRMTGTHKGEFMGIPATGRTINVPVSDYLRFDNGLVVEHWGVMDTGALMEQLTGE